MKKLLHYRKNIIIEINRKSICYYNDSPSVLYHPPIPKPRLGCLCNKCRQIHKLRKKNNNKLHDWFIADTA